MLKLSHISKTFAPGTINAKKALDDLTLEVADGEFITIIGSNGAGKSTLFNAIAGSFLIDSGSIMLGGRDVTLLPEHLRARKIGRLFQDPLRGTAAGMTIEENLMLAAGKGGWFTRMDNKQRNEFREILSRLNMGLEDRMKQPMGLLSGGQRQAVTLLMATINPPSILLLDEHTAALDPAAADKVQSITEDTVKKEHLTCLMITHNMRSALEMGSRTIMMEGGRIILDVSGAEREAMTVQDLLDRFREVSGKAFDNDRMMLTTD
ncbi:MAG: ATP-binding cassette domain-containing protein [Lachnospiraceae bacterium]|nr:ATP-binding cassette domain-containing protein [Lachnospiraceae bacterium]